MTAQSASLDLFLEFVRLLRTAGLRVGLTETQDALSALSLLDDLRDTRTALKATLIKRKLDETIFDRVYELFFGFAPEARILQLHNVLDNQSSSTLTLLNDAQGEEGHEGNLPGSSHSAHRTAASYEQTLERAVQLILRYAYHRDDPHTARRTQEAIALMSRMVQKRTETEKDLDEVRQDVERAFLKKAGDPEALEALLRQEDFENIEFSRIDETETELIERAIEQLVAELALRPRRRYHPEKHSRIDIRRTIRKSIQYGGTPIKLARKKRRTIEPKIFLLADVSSSVEAFAHFFLMLTRAFHVAVGTCRSFIFVDQICEITERLEAEMVQRARPGQVVEQVLAQLRLQGWGISHSDYGTVLQSFYEQCGSQIDHHTVIVILGDARTNFALPRAQWLQRLHNQTERIIWLNPERKALWDSGDSIVSAYALHCDQVLECRNLKQLKDIVREITL